MYRSPAEAAIGHRGRLHKTRVMTQFRDIGVSGQSDTTEKKVKKQLVSVIKKTHPVQHVYRSPAGAVAQE